jgi:DHA1 family bicyclomycin/chloramphenicol resistance-like MFS transporter
MVFGYLGGRLSERWSEKGTLVTGLGMCVFGAGGLLATAALHLPLIAVILSLFTMVSGVAVTSHPRPRSPWRTTPTSPAPRPH